jgi:hypothetical protein
MALVATLVANPSNPVLSPEIAERASDAVKASGLYWLADGIACDIVLADGSDRRAAEANLLAVIANSPIDLVIQEQETRRKKLLIADMDSTMIGQECIDELAAEVGLKEKVAAITARAMNGEIAFEPALRERVALLKGLPISVVDEVIAKRITLTPGGPELIATSPAASQPPWASTKTAPISCLRKTASSPATSRNPFSASRPRSMLSTTSPPASAFPPEKPLPSATAPTISACCIWPAPASPSTPNRLSLPKPTCRSTTAT